MRYEGKGVPKDLGEAIAWTKKAAEKDHAEAAFNMAAFYTLGHGVEKDPQQALHWTRRAAETGYVRAQASLGSHLIAGKETKADYVAAREWLVKAAAILAAIASLIMELSP